MNDYELIIDDDYASVTLSEGEELKPIISDFVKSYTQNPNESTEKWLTSKIQEYLPDKAEEEIQQISEEIFESIKVAEDKKASLSEAISNERSKEGWFASEVKQATAAMSEQEAAQYLNSLDNAVSQANESLYHTITTQASNYTAVSQNPHLDGFIAEQYHAQTFNMNAETIGSPYRAEVLEPEGNGYAKNSVDIVIKDGEGNIVRKYQSKYCKDSEATEQAFEHGDYRGQRKLVPTDQKDELSLKASDILESPDGVVTSNPLTKSRAEQMRDEAQSGNWNELNWNEYKAKDLAVGIGKQVGYAAIQGAAIGVGFNVAQKIWDGEDIEADEIVETALESGADFSVKTAISGAVKVGAEKGIISIIPKGTPASIISNIVFVGVEDAKVFGDVISGDLSWEEGLDKVEQTTVSTAAGLLSMGKGAAVGAAIGTVLGPVGAAVGGFVGGTVGYMAGSKVGETVVKGAQVLRDAAVEVASTIMETGKEIISSVGNAVGDFVGDFLGLFL